MFSKAYTEYAKNLCNGYAKINKDNGILSNLLFSIQCISILYR